MSPGNTPEDTDSHQPPTIGKPSRGRTILVVEDETNIRSLIVSVLERAGYSVVQAANGADALELCVHSPRKVDLLITDWAMPVMNGVELLREVSTVKPAMRLILLSAKNPGSLPELRGVSVLGKPFTIKGLLAKIVEVLND